MAGDDDTVLVTSCLNVMPKTVEQRLIVHNGKSEKSALEVLHC